MQKVMKFFVPMFVAILVLLPFTQADEVSAASTFEDGEYNISMSVLSEGGGTSIANDYLSNSATLVVKDGKNTLHLTVKQDADMVKATTVGGKKGSKSGSTFTFNDIDLSQNMSGTMHVVVPKEQLPPNGYDKNHTVTFTFDTSNIPAKGDSGKAEDSKKDNEEAGEPVDKNKDKDNENKNNEDEDATGQTTAEENPPTGDHAPILLFTVVLLASGMVLVRKVAFK